jgi:UDP-N-acetylmuramoyl-tripeptide--D-alanyl-D-alanine ligase
MQAVWGKIVCEELLAPTRGTWVSGRPQTILRGLSTDSREIRTGELFWALKGERFDGHDFIEKAVDLGAAGIVVQKGYIPNSRLADPVVIAVDDTLRALGDLAQWWRGQHKLQVVAITGSAGKTTTKEMVASILELGNKTLKTHGNFNNLIGLPLTLFQLDRRHGNAVLEMGMNRPGEIARLTEIADPDVGVITNVRMAHLEGLGDLDGVARAKWELAEKISASGTMVLNGDDELLMKKRALFQGEAFTFGLERKNDVSASGIRTLGRDGTTFDLHYQGESWRVMLRVAGLQNIVNALAAAAVGLCLKQPPTHIVEGLGRFEGMKGRFKVIPLPGEVVLVDDTYNANPSALKAALESVEALVDKGGRIIVGLGEMSELGLATIPAHQEAGRMVAELGAHLFLAMGEHAQEMTSAAVREGMPLDRVGVVTTHEEMRIRITEEMREGDLVFLKGSREVGLEKVVENLASKK